MKMFLNAILVSLVFSTAAQAADFGLTVGVRSNSADVNSPSTTKSQMGFQVGATTTFPISETLHLRTGMLYTQRPIIVQASNVETTYSLNYLDVPVQVLYKVEDYAGVFAGVVVANNFDKSCSGSAGCSVSGVTSPLLPLTFGATFKFAPQLGGTIQFETSSGDATSVIKNMRSIGANFVVFFE